MSNLTVLENRKIELHNVLTENKGLVNTLSDKDKSSFSQNFIELANNDYLMKTVIEKKLILRLALDLTKQGLDVHPSKKHCYIVPFNTEINGQNVMLPQVIIPLKGHQQKALKSGFMLRAYQVWKLEDGSIKSEKEMDFEEKIQIDETSEDDRNNKFFGWNIELLDLTNTLPLQVKFVSYKYSLKATKNMNTPKDFILSGLVHKAVRRAVSEFAIPSDRDFDIAIEPIDTEIVATDSVKQDPFQVKDGGSKKKLDIEDL